MDKYLTGATIKGLRERRGMAMKGVVPGRPS